MKDKQIRLDRDGIRSMRPGRVVHFETFGAPCIRHLIRVSYFEGGNASDLILF